MKVIWKLASEPVLAGLPVDDVKRLVLRADESKAVRQSSLRGLILCGLCAGFGAVIGDTFSSGIYGAALGGGVGGFIYSQVRMRAALKWIETQIAIPSPDAV